MDTAWFLLAVAILTADSDVANRGEVIQGGFMMMVEDQETCEKAAQSYRNIVFLNAWSPLSVQGFTSCQELTADHADKFGFDNNQEWRLR